MIKTGVLIVLMAGFSMKSIAGRFEPEYIVARAGMQHTTLYRFEPQNVLFGPYLYGDAKWSPHFSAGAMYKLSKRWGVNAVLNYSTYKFEMLGNNIYFVEAIANKYNNWRTTQQVRLHYLQFCPEIEYKAGEHLFFYVGFSAGYKEYDRADIAIKYTSTSGTGILATTDYTNKHWLFAYTYGVGYGFGKNRLSVGGQQLFGKIYRTSKYDDTILTLSITYSRLFNFKKKDEK